MSRSNRPTAVIAGLDPAIHHLRKMFLRRGMDPRVKPAGDAGGRAVSQDDRNALQWSESRHWAARASPGRAINSKIILLAEHDLRPPARGSLRPRRDHRVAPGTSSF